MSSSSLWAIDKEFQGEKLIEFNNSWLFIPIAWNILLQKYFPVESQNGKKNFLTVAILDKSVDSKLNHKINECRIQEDRVLWELGNQQVFFTRDKEFVADCIVKFLETNSELAVDLGEHIHDRYKEVAAEIRAINQEEHPYFVLKNTSCDDNVEYWFEKYNEDEGEYEPRSLREITDKTVTEFVVINERKIIKFIDNIDYFKGMKKDS